MPLLPWRDATVPPKHGRGYWRSLGALHGAILLFGVSGLFGKWVSAHPVVIVFGRVLVASAILSVLLRMLPGFFPASRLERKEPFRAREWGLLLGCGIVLAFHWVAFFQSIQVSTVAVGLLSYSTAPVFAVLLEPLWFREPFSRKGLLCAALTFAGVALVVSPWEPRGAVAQGAAWGVLAGFSFAVLSLLNRQLVLRHSSIRIAFYQDAAAMVVLAPFLPWVWQPLSWPDLALLGALGLFCTALAHGLFIEALTRVKAHGAAIASALEPVYGILLAWWLLEESPRLGTLLGGGIIVGAVLWAALFTERLGETEQAGG